MDMKFTYYHQLFSDFLMHLQAYAQDRLNGVNGADLEYTKFKLTFKIA